MQGQSQQHLSNQVRKLLSGGGVRKKKRKNQQKTSLSTTEKWWMMNKDSKYTKKLLIRNYIMATDYWQPRLQFSNLLPLKSPKYLKFSKKMFVNNVPRPWSHLCGWLKSIREFVWALQRWDVDVIASRDTPRRVGKLVRTARNVWDRWQSGRLQE